MSNVIPLFPAATDEQYEDLIVPALIEAMQLLGATTHASRPEVPLCQDSCRVCFSEK